MYLRQKVFFVLKKSTVVATQNGYFPDKQLKILRRHFKHLEACLCSNSSKDKNVSHDGVNKTGNI
ncbi:hypothetical protein DOY81_004085 [Sarcophaga bullata]|nr:hypothetical protein DOY81_004085 [Sarcophaga bullata]